ncbi:MAG TPA: roadblock/LC7 domain-containing protein [Gemmatimonadales bacterium]|jgi:predicted regulator of Ras-like GTPase activity (Roadblock/LC7/MglB family)|nr:roadblock/LC7 domain-containing protein [Gemmatimonadales bacterium]
MPGLRDLVQSLAARPEVDAVVVVSGDGLPIDHAGRTPVDAEAIAALTTTFASGARRLGHAAQCDNLASGVLEYGDRLAVVRALTADTLLFILAARATNIGPLLFDLRRDAPRLASLL